MFEKPSAKLLQFFAGTNAQKHQQMVYSYSLFCFIAEQLHGYPEGRGLLLTSKANVQRKFMLSFQST
jgi:hypothetical protein